MNICLFPMLRPKREGLVSFLLFYLKSKGDGEFIIVWDEDILLSSLTVEKGVVCQGYFLLSFLYEGNRIVLPSDLTCPTFQDLHEYKISGPDKERGKIFLFSYYTSHSVSNDTRVSKFLEGLYRSKSWITHDSHNNPKHLLSLYLL